MLNVLPPMRAGTIAVSSGLANANARWCHVNWLNFESTAAKDVHVLGDSIQLAQGMPKSGHMANSHAKVAAAAIVAELSGAAINPQPVLNNTCYSFVDAKNVIHVASVHEYVAAEKTFKPVAGSGGVSQAPNELEGVYALELGPHDLGRQSRLKCCAHDRRAPERAARGRAGTAAAPRRGAC